MNANNLNNLNSIVKWRCDGAFGISEFERGFVNSTICDSSIFVSLQFILDDPNSAEQVLLW